MHARILLSVLFLPFGVVAQEPSGPARLLPRATLTLGEAVQRALVEAASGTAWKAELEEDKGKVVFSVDIAQGEKNCNVVLDAADGKVVEKDLENEDHS